MNKRDKLLDAMTEIEVNCRMNEGGLGTIHDIAVKAIAEYGEPEKNYYDIIWTSRYSDTDEPDNRGRWARIAYYNSFQIGWCSKVDHKGVKFFTIKTTFPANGNDTVHEFTHFDTLDECKVWLKEQWELFISKLDKPKIIVEQTDPIDAEGR